MQHQKNALFSMVYKRFNPLNNYVRHKPLACQS
jgi:hypothetical protein